MKKIIPMAVIFALIVSPMVMGIIYEPENPYSKPIDTKPMQVQYIINATVMNEHNIRSRNLTFSDALNGSSYLLGNATARMRVSNTYVIPTSEYLIARCYFSFDTSVLNNTNLINATLMVHQMNATQWPLLNWSLNLYEVEYGSSLVGDDWNATVGAFHGGLPAVSVNTTRNVTLDTGTINKTGNTQFRGNASTEGITPSATIGWFCGLRPPNALNLSLRPKLIIWVDVNPVADAGVDKYGDTQHFINGSASYDPDGSIVNYTWNFTYNSIPVYIYTSTFYYTFSTTGTYVVTLNVTDDDTLYDEDNMVVYAFNHPPIANASGNRTLPRGDYMLSAVNSYDVDADGSIVNYSWEVDYNSTIVWLFTKLPVFNFTALRYANISLNVTDNDGMEDWDNITYIIINQNPIANAGNNQTGKRVINFVGSNSYDPDWYFGSIVNYTWNFTYNSLPQNMYGATPSFDFNISGIYIVTLNVTDNDGGWDEDDVWITTSIQSPIANAGADQRNIKGITTFDGTGSSDPDGSIVNYTWNFTYNSLPETMYGSQPTFDFQIAGFYNVTLNVTDDDWRWDEDIVMIEMYLASPIANAGSDITGKRIITFDGSGSRDIDGSIVNYTWEFTYDNATENLYDVSPSFDFYLTGVYTITLNVTDDDALWDEDTLQLTIIFVKPVADAGLDVYVITNTTFTFDGRDSYDPDGTVVNWTWNFTYNSTSVYLYGAVVNYTFGESIENFTVQLKVVDDDGLWDLDHVTLHLNTAMGITLIFLIAILLIFIVMAIVVFVLRSLRKPLEEEDG